MALGCSSPDAWPSAATPFTARSVATLLERCSILWWSLGAGSGLGVGGGAAGTFGGAAAARRAFRRDAATATAGGARRPLPLVASARVALGHTAAHVW
jgi:hypothetical protein